MGKDQERTVRVQEKSQESPRKGLGKYQESIGMYAILKGVQN